MTATRREHMRQEVPGHLAIATSVQGTTTTISLRGEWDLAQKPAMRSVVNDVLERAPDCVVLDLSRLSFIDSAGVHGILELDKRSTQQDVHLVIVPGPRAVQRIFELVGLTEVLPFLPDQPGIEAARPHSARPGTTRAAGALSPPPATPAADRHSGRRR